MALDQSLPDRAEVVIIGGGVMGASAAFHLAEAGVTDVLLVEADQLSCGSTSKSAGGVRLQFSDEINIALALRSMDAFERFAERPGAEIGLQQVGYLFLLTDPADVTAFEKNTALQNSMGVPSRMISAERGRAVVDARQRRRRAGRFGVHARRPRHARCRRARLCNGGAGDGRVHCNPLPGDWNRRRRRRHHRRTNCTRHRGDLDGDLRCRCVVSSDCRNVRCRSPGATRRPTDLVHRADAQSSRARADDDRLHHRLLLSHRGPRIAVRDGGSRSAAGFDSPMRPDWLEVVGDVVAHRAPALLDVGIAGGWHGFYETTPDHNALIGEAADVSRFIYATGFSGHGFLLGPAVGEVLRDLVDGSHPAG